MFVSEFLINILSQYIQILDRCRWGCDVPHDWKIGKPTNGNQPDRGISILSDRKLTYPQAHLLVYDWNGET